MKHSFPLLRIIIHIMLTKCTVICVDINIQCVHTFSIWHKLTFVSFLGCSIVSQVLFSTIQMKRISVATHTPFTEHYHPKLLEDIKNSMGIKPHCSYTWDITNHSNFKIPCMHRQIQVQY